MEKGVAVSLQLDFNALPAMDIISHFRHQLSFLAALGVMLASWHLLAPEQVEAVNKAGAQLIEPLLVILGAIAVFLSRQVMAWLSGFLVRKDRSGKGTSGTAALLLLIGTAAVISMAGALSSCSPDQIRVMKDVPIKGCVFTDQGKVCYSSKSGLEVDADLTKRVTGDK